MKKRAFHRFFIHFGDPQNKQLMCVSFVLMIFRTSFLLFDFFMCFQVLFQVLPGVLRCFFKYSGLTAGVRCVASYRSFNTYGFLYDLSSGPSAHSRTVEPAASDPLG